MLLGTALGDALGLPMEGMSARGVARTFPRIDRYFWLGRTGFVSDDTEQSALVAQSLKRHGQEVRAFRRALLGWFARLPWGIGLGTLRACVKIALGLERSGVHSAGNGAAMRAAIVGAYFSDDAEKRRSYSDAIATVTHLDPRAIDGARFVAEIAAQCVRDRAIDVGEARAVLRDARMIAAIDRAADLARRSASTREASGALGNTGYVVSSVALATFCFLRYKHDPLEALAETIRAGGDTDSNAAIVGAWVGALHGARGLPQHLVERLHDGPFGPTHLRALAADLASSGPPTAKFSAFFALARNLALFPVALAHAVRVVFRRSV